MKVIVGSKNKAKVKAVSQVFLTDTVIAKNTVSDVSAQPFTDEETRLGAINRAKHSVVLNEDNIGIGLEGGVMYIGEELYLCNWGALVTNERYVYTASGARILLPNELAKQLKRGIELGDLIDNYTNKSDVRSNEGTIGIFTNGIVSREEMFAHVVKLLKGQWEYALKKRSN